MSETRPEFSRLFVFHDSDPKPEAGLTAACDAAIIRASAWGYFDAKSRAHPMLVAANSLRTRPMLRMLKAGAPQDGPAKDPGWGAVEWYDFESPDRMSPAVRHLASARSSGHVRYLPTRAYGLTGAADNSPAALLFTLRARPGVSREEMHRIWLEEHSKLVLDGAEAMGFAGYVQAHTVDTDVPADVEVPEVDAVGILTYPTMATFAARGSSPSAFRANVRLIRDEARFVHAPATTMSLGSIQTG